MDQQDPNVVILERLNALRDEIMIRLDRIEKELENLNNNILDAMVKEIFIVK